MPVDPISSRARFPDPRVADGDVVAVGGDLEPGTILSAYRQGIFPMNLKDGRLGWWSPVERAILPFGEFHISRSLRQATRRFQVSVDSDFEGVIRGCADPSRRGGWITDEFVAVYTELYRMGWAHSVEVWDSDGDLAGGLYGIGISGLFAGESMFHRMRDASKVALVHLVVTLVEGEGRMLDIQWATPHLRSLGAAVIGRDAYLDRLPWALAGPDPFQRAAEADSR
jgi:leucyl/phenylalanyl-tRNA--protein transferase